MGGKNRDTASVWRDNNQNIRTIFPLRVLWPKSSMARRDGWFFSGVCLTEGIRFRSLGHFLPCFLQCSKSNGSQTSAGLDSLAPSSTFGLVIGPGSFLEAKHVYFVVEPDMEHLERTLGVLVSLKCVLMGLLFRTCQLQLAWAAAHLVFGM